VLLGVVSSFVAFSQVATAITPLEAVDPATGLSTVHYLVEHTVRTPTLEHFQ
jgi:hypothetical protein